MKELEPRFQRTTTQGCKVADWSAKANRIMILTGLASVILLAVLGAACGGPQHPPELDAVSDLPPSSTPGSQETRAPLQTGMTLPAPTKTSTRQPTASPTMTEIPAVSEYSWWTTPPAPVATCSIEAVNVTPATYPLASVKPGYTTKEKIREMLGPPDDVYGSREHWYYDFPLAIDIAFDGDIVAEQCEYRLLEEILAWYAPPSQVIWLLPKIRFDEASEWTYLLFSERERYCQTEGWISRFQHNEDRFTCCFHTSEDFDKLDLKYPTGEEIEGYWIVKFDWPCTSP